MFKIILRGKIEKQAIVDYCINGTTKKRLELTFSRATKGGKKEYSVICPVNMPINVDVNGFFEVGLDNEYLIDSMEYINPLNRFIKRSVYFIEVR